jgi:mercuric ion transport protein
LKSFGWGITALLTCPCHLVLLIPLLADTTFGAYIAVHKTFTGIIFGIIFTVSLYMIFKRINKETDSSKDCCFPSSENEAK